MISIGKYNTLKIIRETSIGLYLGDADEDVLLPQKYVPFNYKIGQEVVVFVYLDQDERKVATTLEPYIYLGEFAMLRVNYVNEFGAFLDWGLEKDLFVPFAEQAHKMEKGKRYIVHLYLDEKSNRLVASSRTNQFLSNAELTVEQDEEVELLATHFTDAGLNVIVNELHKGLVHASELFDATIRPGDRFTGYVKQVRPDNKLDISLNKSGYAKVEPNAAKILETLKNSRGFLRLNDDSNPDDIKNLLQMSKKTFKKAIGALYKERLIEITGEGIRLVKEGE